MDLKTAIYPDGAHDRLTVAAELPVPLFRNLLEHDRLDDQWSWRYRRSSDVVLVTAKTDTATAALDLLDRLTEEN